MWQLETALLSEFIPGESEYKVNPIWKKIECTGICKPKPIYKHTSVVFEDKMYLFGGLFKDRENPDMYSLDLAKFQW